MSDHEMTAEAMYEHEFDDRAEADLELMLLITWGLIVLNASAFWQFGYSVAALVYLWWHRNPVSS